MEEQDRRVRTNSNEMGRPYFSINYKLSLSGRDLLSMAFSEMNQADGEVDGNISAADEIALQRRASDLSSMKQDLSLKEIVEEVTDNAPGTPKSAHQKKSMAGNNNNNTKRGGSSVTTTAPPPPLPPTHTDSNTQDDIFGPGGAVIDDKALRKVKSSSGIREIELNRTAPAAPISSLKLKVADGSGELLQGFVTCLNSRNVQKYRKGQKYRDGLIVGIDEEHGKIIVYNEALPRGALTIMKTRDSARYERGFQVEDIKGKSLGIVHAVDREANLIVLNSSTDGGGGSSGSVAPPEILPTPSTITQIHVGGRKS